MLCDVTSNKHAQNGINYIKQIMQYETLGGGGHCYMKQECGLGRDDAVPPTYTISTYCYIKEVREKFPYEKFPEWIYI